MYLMTSDTLAEKSQLCLQRVSGIVTVQAYLGTVLNWIDAFALFQASQVWSKCDLNQKRLTHPKSSILVDKHFFQHSAEGNLKRKKEKTVKMTIAQQLVTLVKWP